MMNKMNKMKTLYFS